MPLSRICLVALVAIMAPGCTISPPPPPKPTGDYRPVNRLPQVPHDTAIPRVFDMDYRGDLEGALAEISKHQPQIRIDPPQGERQPVEIMISVRQVTLEHALQLLARQARGIAEIVHRPDSLNKTDSILIRYR